MLVGVGFFDGEIIGDEMRGCEIGSFRSHCVVGFWNLFLYFAKKLVVFAVVLGFLTKKELVWDVVDLATSERAKVSGLPIPKLNFGLGKVGNGFLSVGLP